MTSGVSAGSFETATPIPVNAQTFQDIARELPIFVRKAFGYALKLQYGALTATLPDGKKYHFEAPAPGPSAEIIIHDLAFGKRLLEGGDIGFAEAYIAGEWDTPDLTTFLYLFCVRAAPS